MSDENDGAAPAGDAPATDALALAGGALVAPGGDALTLRQLHAALIGRGVKISYTALSELISTGDIAEQLRAGGAGNRRAFPAGTANTLAGFWPFFRASRAKASEAPDMLRDFLRRSGSDGEMLVPIFEFQKPETTPTLPAHDLLLLAAAQGRAVGLAHGEEVLTAQEAADLLKISVTTLRASVPPWKRFGQSARGDRWRRSDLLDL